MRNQSLAWELRTLQVAQYRHDQTAHQDILALPLQRRLTHFTLHFAKYVGGLARAHRHGDRDLKRRVVTDSLVIALAMANAMDVDLQGCLESDLSSTTDESSSFEHILLRYAEVVGEMSKACEALDHLEDYPFRAVLERDVSLLVPLIIQLAALDEFDLGSAVRERWSTLERKPRVYRDDGLKKPAAVSVAA